MIALHGFLGRPEDWNGVLGERWATPDWLRLPLPPLEESAEGGDAKGGVSSAGIASQVERGEGVRGEGVPRVQDDGSCGRNPCPPRQIETRVTGTITPALGAPTSLKGEDYLWRLAHGLDQSVQGDTLLGYSMGGRIALHMLIQEPQRWRRAIIVSASPGLRDPAERETRREGDEAWAGRFLHDDWDAVVADWNAQGVFAHDPPDRLPRRERDFDRHALAAALALGSVAHQADLRAKLRTLDLPILWIAGAKDAKYAALAAECAALNPRFSMTTLRTGHRVPWGDPAAFRKAVDDFITIQT